MFRDASFVLSCETEHLAGAFTRRSMRRLWIVRQSLGPLVPDGGQEHAGPWSAT